MSHIDSVAVKEVTKGEGGSKLSVPQQRDRRGTFIRKKLKMNRKSPSVFAAKFGGVG